MPPAFDLWQQEIVYKLGIFPDVWEYRTCTDFSNDKFKTFLPPPTSNLLFLTYKITYLYNERSNRLYNFAVYLKTDKTNGVCDLLKQKRFTNFAA